MGNQAIVLLAKKTNHPHGNYLSQLNLKVRPKTTKLFNFLTVVRYYFCSPK